MTDEDRKAARTIQRAIRERESSLFEAHPWLRNQNAIGLAIFLVCVVAQASLSVAYAERQIPAWATIVGVALTGSIFHELEHDLIHDLYFPRHRLLQGFMLLLGWLARPNIVNPWIRKVVHLHHHKASGKRSDVEVRAATGGMPMGVRRLIMMIDPLFRNLLVGKTTHKIVIDGVEIKRGWRDLPEPTFQVLTVAWLASLIARPFIAFPLFATLDYIAVIMLVPNIIRRFALVTMTSNNHYVDDHDGLLQETQVLNHWLFLPFNLLSCAFGSTHAIHHFVVPQAFYVRTWIARSVFPVMLANGVRFNDLGTLTRANRFRRSSPGLPADLLTGA